MYGAYQEGKQVEMVVSSAAPVTYSESECSSTEVINLSE